MTTQTQQWPCNTTVKITKVSEVEGNRGPQWELVCEFPWKGQWAETVWVNVDASSTWKPESGSTYPVVVNRRDLKRDKDENTEYNWRHWINGFTHDENLAHYKKQGYSPPSNQSPPTEPQSDTSTAPAALSSGTIGDVLEGAQFGMLLKAAIIDEHDRRPDGESRNDDFIYETFMGLLELNVRIKNEPMPSLVVPLQDDPPMYENASGPVEPAGMQGGPDPIDERG